MINRVLIANRGEIAGRVIRTCRRLGIATVVVHSDSDTQAPYVAEADAAVHLPGNTPSDTYLRVDRLLAAARETGCDAVHPGYGFLAENAAFARAVEEAGLTWIGPPPAAIEAMGSKIGAKAMIRAADVPVLPDNTVESLDEIGLPAIVKASAGGGGRGMRLVQTHDELAEAIAAAEREAASAFGDGTVFVERYVEGGRHVEVQVFADDHGHTVALFERDCTLQRRHQKIVEEAPSPAVDDELRAAMSRRRRRRSGGRLPRRRHRRAPPGRRRHVRVPGDEHPPAGRAPGDRSDHRAGSRRAAAAGRRRRAVAGRRAASGAPRSRHRGAPLRRGPGQRLPAEHRPVPRDRLADGHRDPRGHRRRVRLGGEPVLRLDDRQGHRPRADGAEAARRLADALRRTVLIGPVTNRQQLIALMGRLEEAGDDDDGFDTTWLDRHPWHDDAPAPAIVAAAALAVADARVGDTSALSGIPAGWRNNPTQPQEQHVGEHVVTYRRNRAGAAIDVAVDGEAVVPARTTTVIVAEDQPTGTVTTVFAASGAVRLDVQPRYVSPDEAGRRFARRPDAGFGVARAGRRRRRGGRRSGDVDDGGDEDGAHRGGTGDGHRGRGVRACRPAARLRPAARADRGRVVSAFRGTRPVRIANCSGFFGDRISAAREMVDPAVLDESPVDVLTGDWLAELTMLILHKQRARDAEAGFAGTFLTQMEQVLGTCMDRGIKVVTNAGGLNPAGLAGRVRDLGTRLGLNVNVAHVEGDDLLDRIDGLRPQLTNLDTGAPFTATAVSANAYLGGWGIARALAAGADVVVCPRVTDAAVVVGPAAWWWDWEIDDWDALAGAVVAGHVIECGAQATGGNYSWFGAIAEPARPLGFPIAEIDRDGNTVITKHPGTGGIVDVGAITAQLLYEIGPPAYLNPDVTTHFETIEISEDGPDRVLLAGTCGSPAPPTAKVSINCEGGFRNRMTFVLTGLDQQAKADWVREQLFIRLGGEEQFDEVDVRFVAAPPDAVGQEAASGRLHVNVKSADERVVGRAFSSGATELALASYPGFFTTTPPGPAQSYGMFWPALVAIDDLHHVVVHADGRRETIPFPPSGPVREIERPVTHADPVGPVPGEPLGTVFAARSGDKGGNANVGIYARDGAGYAWLAANMTADALARLIPETRGLEIRRYELPNLNTLNFVIVGYLGDGVAASTAFDPQAKGLGEYLRSRVF